MAGKPAKRFEEQVSTLLEARPSNPKLTSRETQRSVRNDDHGDFTVGIKDIDESIIFYFNNVIKPSVIQKGVRKNVPVIYGNQERWKAVQKDGYYRDRNGKIQAPLIMFRRETLEKNRNVGNKLGADNPQNFYVFERKYNNKNHYDRLSVLTNRTNTKEYQGVVIPDYVTLTYSCVIFTDFIEQNNKLIEAINYASDSYWGDPDKFKFRAMIDNYTTTTDVSEGQDRVTRTSFTLTMNGYIIPDTINSQLQGNRKFYSKSTLKFGIEVAGTLETLTARASTPESQAKSRFFDQGTFGALSGASTSTGGGDLTQEIKDYLSLNNTAAAASINTVTHTATFSDVTITTAPTGFSLGQDEFFVYINNTYIPNTQRTVSQSGDNINVVFSTNDIGYTLNSDDEILLVGKFE
jgi:hypothetical protein